MEANTWQSLLHMQHQPVETILKIFSEVSTSDSEPDWAKPASSFYGWTSISRVSRQWRRLTLLLPRSTWTHVLVGEASNTALNAAAAEFLRRSGNLPVHIYVVVGTSSKRDTGTPRLYEVLQTAILRAVEMKVCLLQETGLDLLWMKMFTSAPLLAKFHVFSLTPDLMQHDTGFPLIPRLFLFRDDTPALHTVHFERFRMSLPTTLLHSGLQRLELSGYDHPNPQQIPLPHLQHVAQSLLALVLTSTIGRNVVYPVPGSILHFPLLQTLSIIGSKTYIPAILNGMSFPGTTTVHARLSYNDRQFKTMKFSRVTGRNPDLAHTFSRLFPDKLPIHAASVDCDGTLECRFWTERGCNNASPWKETGGVPAPRLTFVNAEHAGNRIDVTTLLGRLPLATTKALRLSSTTALDFERWSKVVSKMGGLRRIEIVGWAALACVVRVLRERSTQTPFAELQDIEVVDVDLGAGSEHQDLLNEFANALVARAERGLPPLARFTCTRCSGVVGHGWSAVTKVDVAEG